MKTINDHFCLTQHCEHRAAQRGLSSSAIELALKHGDVYEQKGGASVVKFTKRQRKALLKELKDLIRVLGKDKDIFVVVGDDGSLVTVGRRTRSIRHNH